MRTIFTQRDHQAQYERDGIAHLGRLGPEATDALTDVFRRFGGPVDRGFVSSPAVATREARDHMLRAFTDVFAGELSRCFRDYRLLCGFLVVKNSLATGVVPEHQDWTFVDEHRFASINLWIPLSDTHASNGALAVLPGSHRIRHNIRGSNLPAPVVRLGAEAARLLTLVPMRAGEVLAHDHRVIHCSAANTSGAVRPAVSISLIPAEARALHYLGDKRTPTQATELEVDSAFYQHYQLDQALYADPVANHPVPAGDYPSRTVPFKYVPIGDADVIRCARHHTPTMTNRVRAILRLGRS